jgi:hypothetical protein
MDDAEQVSRSVAIGGRGDPTCICGMALEREGLRGSLIPRWARGGKTSHDVGDRVFSLPPGLTPAAFPCGRGRRHKEVERGATAASVCG